MKRIGIIADTSSPYASPVLLVTKKNGEPPLVVDYRNRKLNKQTVRINYPIPSLDEQFQYLASSKVFASLDLANGYMQVLLTKSASEKTACITPDTTEKFKRMIFGLTNAPYEFVRLMNLVLGPLRNKICCCYLDDAIIPAKNWNELLSRIKLVLSAYRDAKLTLNIHKCEFGKTETDYLGYVICEGGLKPGPRAIEDFPEPKNVHDIRRLLGLSGFFRKFILNYAIIARPLTDLTKLNTYESDDDEQVSYERKEETDEDEQDKAEEYEIPNERTRKRIQRPQKYEDYICY
ncbi:Reverse transcriptase (RNA-dependent DNA polymerase) [Popillia japonica]|uniref:Reverse transcriptase (RNA-dependent DNA polymerase) n=1 Tax=Popillia japonica TaxID=7064 RepID=A0AAW1J030_POPJA